MTSGFVKLDRGIVDSTVWTEPHDVLRVWIAMLAKCDAYGVLRASVPALALLCMVPVPRMVEIIERLQSPDPYSRTPDNDGRRIAPLEDGGGWVILNYVKHRELQQGTPGSHAERQRRYRQRIADRDASISSLVTKRDAENVTCDTEGEGEGEGEEAKDSEPNGSGASPDGDTPESAADTKKTKRSEPVPYEAIVAAYNGTMLRLPKVRELTPKRRTLIRSAWQASPQRRCIEFWRDAYFPECQDDPFTNGTGPYRNGHENWRPDFDYLMRADVVTRIFERAMDRLERGHD